MESRGPSWPGGLRHITSARDSSTTMNEFNVSSRAETARSSKEMEIWRTEIYAARKSLISLELPWGALWCYLEKIWILQIFSGNAEAPAREGRSDPTIGL